MGNPRITLILGIGNILRKDDGFGIHIIERLREINLPADVRLLDGGGAGIDLITYLEGASKLIIIDALSEDGTPGDIKVLKAEDILHNDYYISGHYGSLGDLLHVAGAMWGKPETFIVGVVPEDCETYEIGLSPMVKSSVERAVDLIKEMVKQDA